MQGATRITGCPMCLRLAPGTYTFAKDDVCVEHLEATGIPAFERAHPDGVCTDTCGCMSLDELDRMIAAKGEEHDGR